MTTHADETLPETDETLPGRVYDALMAAGQRALADEYAYANGAGS